MVLLVLGFWPSMCMPTIDYFYIWTTCIEGVKATTPLHCMMRIHFYPTANPLWDVSFFGAVSPEFHMLTVVVLLYVRWGLSIINAVGYCRDQTDIFSVRETVCQSSWTSSVWDRFWFMRVLFQSDKSTVKTYFWFCENFCENLLDIPVPVRENQEQFFYFAFFAFEWLILSLSTGLTPFSGVAHSG